jgi:putative redox protein
MATITTTYKGGMLFESQVGNHKVTIDVPTDMGGADRAPTPPQYFVISLGSCIAAFIAAYCQQAGIDATGLSVDVSFDKVENPTRLINLKVRVKLPRADCEVRKQALLRVAQHCPVHATIDNFDNLEIEILDRKALAAIPA